MIPAMASNRESSFIISLKSGEARRVSDICTRSLNNRNSVINSTIIDTVRFEYTCTGWQWRRAHVLFLRALMREANVPDKYIKQVTVPRLNDPNKGVVFNTHTASGPLILFVHSLIRDLYETPRRYWLAYGLWRKGMNVLDAYNASGWFTVSVSRNGKMSWMPQELVNSQSINHVRFVPTRGLVKELMNLEPYKGKGKLRDYSSGYRLEAHLKCKRGTNAIKRSLPSPTSLKKYAHLFVRG